MKIIVLHGDDTIRSYERLIKFTDEAKKRGWDVLDYDYDSISNQSLFDSVRFYILKDYSKLNKKTLEKIQNLSGNLIVYHKNLLTATILKSINPSKVEKYELPKLLWNFLDTFSLKSFQEVIKTEPVEMVLWWMTQRFKELYWVKEGKPDYPSWRLGKLKSQASKFSIKKLETIISELSELDFKSKTGNSNLKESLDLLIIKSLA